MQLTVEHVGQAIQRLVEQGDVPATALDVSIDLQTPLDELAMDSLALSGMALLLEDVIDQEIEWDEEADLNTVGDIIAAASIS